MSKLSAFLQNFSDDCRVRLFSNNGELLFEGKTEIVPRELTGTMTVIRGTAKWKGEYLEVKVRKG